MKISRVTCNLPAGIRITTKFTIGNSEDLSDSLNLNGLFSSIFNPNKLTVTEEAKSTSIPSSITMDVPAGDEKKVADLLRKMADDLEAP